MTMIQTHDLFQLYEYYNKRKVECFYILFIDGYIYIHFFLNQRRINLFRVVMYDRRENGYN